MKKKLLTLLFVLFSLNFYAQVNYEKSYFISDNGVKTECFIKNKDRNDNPTYFEYKLSAEETQVMKVDIKTVKEVKIADILKFEKATVKLDTSATNIEALTVNRLPEWKEVTIFLKVLVDSETSLYEYKSGNLKRFFYKAGNVPIEQLIYKKFIIDEDLATKLSANNDFQKQLWQNLNCGNKDIDEALKLKYTRKDLIKYFIDYNNCKNNSIVNMSEKLEKGSVNIKANVGFVSSSLSFNNDYVRLGGDFGNKINFTFGAEFEWILPVNRNKWSLYFAPTYNSYKSKTVVTIMNTGPFSSDTELQNWEASFTYLDINLGFRYYMFMNDNSKIFLSGSYIISKVLDSDIHNENTFQLTAKFQDRIGYSIGYSFKNKINVELKHSSTNIFDNYVFFDSNYNLTSLVFGYTIFDSKKKK
jgi:hypothetical protein